MVKDTRKNDLVDSMADEEPSLEEQEKACHKAIAKWFIRSGINPNKIKIPSFAKFMSYLNPRFPPSASKVEKEALEIYKECKEKAKKFLKEFDGQVTLSYEWMVLGNEYTRGYSIKGPILHEDFVCLTAHFVDDNWKMKKWILAYTTDKKVPMEDIFIYPFRNAVQDFEIESKVSALLLPNDVDYDEVTLDPFRKWIEERGKNQIIPRVSLLYCCADLFRLMVDDVYSGLSGYLLEVVRMLVGWGSCSSTNWNVTLFHLQQGVDLKAEDAFSKDEVYDDYDKPSDEDWIKIETYCTLAGCIYKVAKELFEGEYSTANVFFHLIAELKFMLNQELAKADSDYFIGKAKKIMERFDKYWNDMFLILATASVLDPRFKTKYLEFYCSKKEVNVEGSKAETVLDYLSNLYARYAASNISRKPICSVATIDSCDSEKEEEEDYDDEWEEEEDDDDEREGKDDKQKEKEEKKPDAYKDFVLFQEYLKFEGSPRELHESELDSYLKEPVMEWNKDFKALDWWREESQKYPILSRVARDILSIPISCATSWDAYVVFKREPPEFVLSMEPELANAMMCSKKWLRL
ncbi:PREDICTED: zinc finger BED domain-containing protein RICESLEEPER 1-like isoform X2 [Camelina sativa]|uniref:Zinc finger BED domain-containing protein RICESLEEPER 1-like isoform X2 n=1 Tax=Camelina sativa TaxID=90675 RepID=A0ABM0W4Z9_CAMSA|nr:PREDICTED: zinc finger BED domain-containing protein RICESLEEPER 1-like isoform X2 [Camelina sativa]